MESIHRVTITVDSNEHSTCFNDFGRLDAPDCGRLPLVVAGDGPLLGLNGTNDDGVVARTSLLLLAVYRDVWLRTVRGVFVYDVADSGRDVTVSRKNTGAPCADDGCVSSASGWFNPGDANKSQKDSVSCPAGKESGAGSIAVEKSPYRHLWWVLSLLLTPSSEQAWPHSLIDVKGTPHSDNTPSSTFIAGICDHLCT
jgi:hypothetical protein